MKDYDPNDHIIRRKKRGILYYVFWYFVAIAILVIAMLAKGEFTWSRLISTVVFMLIMGVVWYFTDKRILTQEEAALRRMEEKFGRPKEEVWTDPEPEEQKEPEKEPES